MAEVDIQSNSWQAEVRLARVQRVFETLSMAIFFNVPGTLIFGVGLVLGGGAFGALPWERLVWATLVQGVGAWSAFVVYRGRSDISFETIKTLEQRLLLLQILISTGWVLVGWMYWVDGAAANNVAIGMGLFIVTWTMTTLRAPIQTIFGASVGVILVGMAIRFAMAPGYVPMAFLVALPFWLVYLIVISTQLRARVIETLRLVYANGALAGALRRARDAALEEKATAEAANAAKSTFLANMSHELRTPLNAILGFSEIIASQALGPSSKQYASYAHDIHDAGSHLLSLINDLLDVAKIEAGRLEIDPRFLDLREAMDGVERLVRERSEAKGQTLRFVVARDAPYAWADERAFRQILLNLVSNAIKYTQDGGSIRVLATKEDGDGVRIVVEDDGPGIAPEKVPTLFKPFAQIDNRYNRETGGTGLGLSLVGGLIGLHNGRIWVESELGQGTKMFVVFPPNFNENVLPRPQA